VEKRVTLIKFPKGAFFKVYRYWYADLLFEVKFYIVSEHLPDDSDEFTCTVAEGIVVFTSPRIIPLFTKQYRGWS